VTNRRTAQGLSARNKKKKNHKKSKKVNNPNTVKNTNNNNKSKSNLKDDKKPYSNREEIINYFKNLFKNKEENEGQ